MPKEFIKRSSFRRLRKLTAAVVMATVASAPMQAASAAGADSRSMPDLQPQQAEAAISAAATVVTEAPLWKMLQLTNCNASSCYGRLPSVPRGERWMIQFVSCTADTALEGELRHFSVQVGDATLTKLLGHHFIAPTYQSVRLRTAVYTASQPMVLTAGAGNVLLFTALATAGVGGGQCSVTGLRQKLG